jgi:hypothetical protein
MYGYWWDGECSEASPTPNSVRDSHLEISMGDAFPSQPTPRLEEEAIGESSEQQENDEEIGTLGTLERISESQHDGVFVSDNDDENDSSDPPPASSLDRTMNDTSIEDVSVKERDLENQNEDEKQEERNPLESQKEDEKQEESNPQRRLKAAALAVTGAVALGAVRVIEQCSDFDETDLEMGPKGETEVAQSASNQGAAKASGDGAVTGNGGGNDGGGAAAKAGGNDGGGAAAKAGGNDGGGAAAKGGGSGGEQSNPSQ